MPSKKYSVDLTDAERTTLTTLIKTGRSAARTITRAQTLLAAADGHRDTDSAALLRIGTATVERIRRRFVEEGLAAALTEQPRPGGERKLDPKQEAMLVALAWSAAPDDRSCWTMQLLADTLVTLGVVEAISDETVRRILKKTTSNHGRCTTGVCRPSGPSSSGAWKICLICTPNHTIPPIQLSVLMNVRSN